MNSCSRDVPVRSYRFIYYCLFKWYASQGADDPESSKWDAEWYAWASLSYFGTAVVISIEVLAAMVGLRFGVMYADISWLPSLLKYGWSFPLFLVMNYALFIRGMKGRSVIRFFESQPSEALLLPYRLVGIGLHILFFLSLGLAIVA